MFGDIVNEVMKSADLQSLQNLAAVRVAISVCESEDVQYMIGRFRKTSDNGSVGFSDGQWTRLRGKARRKLYQIGVPNSIIDIILKCLWPISFEVFKWIRYHIEDIGIEYSSHFCWTSHANIDFLQTATILIKNESLDIKKRFKLACFYCLELEVRFLWEMMSLAEKRIFYIRRNLRKFDQNPIVFYWTYYIQEVPIDSWEIKAFKYTNLFKYAVENGYLWATKYFFGKLKMQLRVRMISNSFSMYLSKLYRRQYIVKDHLAIAYFLICQLPPNYEHFHYLKMRSLAFLYFLEWPMQKYFISVVDRMNSNIRARIYGDLLEGIMDKEIFGFKDYDYKKLFMEFWHTSPENFKTYVNTESRVGCTMFMKFIKKHFGFIFEEKSFVLKAKFRTLLLQRETAENLTYFEKENVEFFKFLVRERVTTKSSINSFSFPPYIDFPFLEFEIPVFNLPLGELMYLMDSILGIGNELRSSY